LNEPSGHVKVSRLIAAPAATIFQIIADSNCHPDFDGSGMLRRGSRPTVVSRVGDEFMMSMHQAELGDYVMCNRIVEYNPNRRIAWEPTPGDQVAIDNAQVPFGTSQGYRWSFDLSSISPGVTMVTERFDCSGAGDEIRDAVDNGRAWLETMERSLALLEVLCCQGDE
jgi:RNA polymerase sigma-70 factor, ECF subfamily